MRRVLAHWTRTDRRRPRTGASEADGSEVTGPMESFVVDAAAAAIDEDMRTKADEMIKDATDTTERIESY